MWKYAKTAGVVLGVSGLALGGDLCYRRGLKEYCHLPNYNYQPVRGTNPVSAVSNISIAGVQVTSLPLPANGVITNGTKILRVKQFQMNDSALRSDHCTLSKISVTLVEDGTWMVNAVAEQNPNSVSSVDQPRFIEFKRNGFHVRVRGVGLSTATDPPEQAVLGKPEYFDWKMPCFWVERGQIVRQRWNGQDAEAQRFFELVDRVEVDLRYE